MFHKFILIAFSCFLPLFIFSQQTESRDRQRVEYNRFKEILEKEISEPIEGEVSVMPLILHPARIPDWFCNIPISDPGNVYAIGISDPGMDMDDAYELAIERAKAITSLMISSSIKSLADNYTNEKNPQSSGEFVTKYLNYFSIHSGYTIDTANFKVLRRFLTAYDEAIVLTSYSMVKSGQDDLSEIVAEVYQVERQLSNTFEAEEKIMFNSSDTSQLFAYTIYSRNNLFEINSSRHGKDILFPYLNYRYTAPDSVYENINGFDSKLTHGLWKSYLELFLQNAWFLSQNSDLIIKQVDDEFTGKSQNLTRSVNADTPAFAVTGIMVKDNLITIKLDYLTNTTQRHENE
jgi:hypothetical protein